nr:hypothetical protein [Gluconacetobacter tumulisoli]
MVAERLSWRVLVLGWFGLLLQGCWIAGLLAGAVSLATWALLGHSALIAPVWLGLHLGLALCTGNIREWELRLNGLTAGPVVVAPGAEAALLRLLERHPGILAPRAATAGE